MKVPARILPPPSVMYARGRDARPNDGSWNLRGKEVSLPASNHTTYPLSCPRPDHSTPTALALVINIIINYQFFRNGNQPLKAWSVISFDRYTDVDEMKRYISYLMDTLITHGVKIANKTPTLVGPINPIKEIDVKNALQTAARAAFKAGGCAPQLIFVILPGR
jgi:eukaryotic translation initiation factor 2C